MDIRNQKRILLSELWKDIFGDTDEYINLIFNNIYNEKLSPVDIRNSLNKEKKEAVSGVVVIDYHLGCAEKYFNGAYLCGVATRPEYRREGLMKTMLIELLSTLQKEGFSFAFLIPADEHLRRYYSRIGFRDWGYKRILRILNENDRDLFLKVANLDSEQKSNPKNKNLTTVKSVEDNVIEVYNSANITLRKIECITELLNNYENSYSGMIIKHSHNQMQTAIREWFMSEGKVIVFKRRSSLALVADDEDIENRRVVNITLLANDRNSCFEMIETFLKSYPDRKFSFTIPPNIEIREMSSLEERKKYGMIKILDNSEILNFAYNQSKDCKYSILAKDTFSADLDYCSEKIEGISVGMKNPWIYFMMD